MLCRSTLIKFIKLSNKLEPKNSKIYQYVLIMVFGPKNIQTFTSLDLVTVSTPRSLIFFEILNLNRNIKYVYVCNCSALPIDNNNSFFEQKFYQNLFRSILKFQPKTEHEEEEEDFVFEEKNLSHFCHILGWLCNHPKT